MKRIRSVLLLTAVSLSVLLAGCVTQVPRWNPEERKVALYGGVTVDVAPRYTHAGSMRVNVVGEGDIVTVIPRDTFETEVFTADGAVLLSQRLAKLDRFYHFRFLGGEKTEAWGKTWRVANYVLDTTAPDAEFAQYLAFLHDEGVTLPPKVRVQILDRLSGEFTLQRAVTLLYSGDAGSVDGLEPLPPFRKLYDQEQHIQDPGNGWPFRS